MESESSVPRRLRGRIIYFLIIFPTILLAVNLLVCATWNFFWKTPHFLLWLAVSSALTLAFTATTVLGIRFTSAGLRVAYRISALWLGVLSNCFFAAGAAWIISTVAGLLSIHVEPRLIATICFGTALIASVYGFGNACTLRVTRLTVKLPNLPANWHGRSVAFVSDMHLGNVWRAGSARRVVAKLLQLSCEAIFIGGDLFDGPKVDLDEPLEAWKQAAATKRIFYITGNHEEFTGREKYLDAVARAGIRILNNEKVEIDGLQLVGIHDREAHAPKAYRALLQHAGLDRNRASILLLHQPVNMPITAEEGISLQLSGHTHGGQFWPWIYFARRVHGPFVYGLNRFDSLQVYTSYGAGTWGAPMRLGTKSEIVLLRLETAAP